MNDQRSACTQKNKWNSLTWEFCQEIFVCQLDEFSVKDELWFLNRESFASESNPFSLSSIRSWARSIGLFFSSNYPFPDPFPWFQLCKSGKFENWTRFM